MTRIDLDEPDLGASVALGLALLRTALAAIVLGHSLQRLFAFTSWHTELARLGIPYAELVALASIAAGLFAGVGLAFGWLTRLAAFLAFATTGFALALLHLRHDLAQYPELVELPALMLATAFFFMWMRGGVLSVDYVLQKRARWRAIQRDDIWLRPPYVAARGEDTYPSLKVRS